MSRRETTANVRTTAAEKEAWRKIAPGGKLSAWLRMLANREVEQANNK